MHANSSPFEPNPTTQTRNNIRDVSFSSYLNKADENMVRKLTKKHEHDDEDGEIGVFGAEKYFKGEIEIGGNKNDLRFIDTINSIDNNHNSITMKNIQQEDVKFEEYDQRNMHTPSVRSNASCGSRSSLLPRNRNKARTFLARFGCDCMNKKSTQIDEKIIISPKAGQINIRTPSVRSNVSGNTRMNTDQLSSKLTETKTRNDYFSFHVTDSNSSSNSKLGNLAGKLEVDGMYIPSSRMYNSDADSVSSSDLFEIESFSPAGDSSVFGHRKTKSNCYAPSEVSVEWSVVTASVADFSVVSDYEVVRGGGGGRRNFGRNGQVKDDKGEPKKRSGILSGCTSHKAVRVAEDEYKVWI